MKKTAFVFIVVFSLVLASVCFGEDSNVYKPGAPAQALIDQAISSGRMIANRFSAALDMEDSVFGEAGAATIAGLEKLLEGTVVYTAGGITPDGLRLEFACGYTNETDNSVSADISLMLSREGISAESSLLEGKRISARWETLLGMAGMPQEWVDQAMAVLNTDFEALIAQIAETLPEIQEKLTTVATPYVMTLLSFAQNLPLENMESVPAEGYFPAVDHAVSVTITQTDIAALLDSLADVMAQDENIPALAAQYGTTVSLEETVSELRKAAESLRAEEAEQISLTAEVGYCDAGLPAYLTIVAQEDASGNAGIFQLIAEFGEDSSVALQSHVLKYNGAEYTEVFNAACDVAVDPDDPQAFSATASVSVQSDGVPQTVQYEFKRTAREPEDGLLGYDIYVSETIDTGSNEARTTVNEIFEGYNKQTAAGGESSYAEGSVSVSENGQEIVSLSLTVADLIDPDPEFVFSRDTELSFASPSVGLHSLNFSVWSGGVVYDAESIAALTNYPVEEMTEDIQQQLVMEVMSNAYTLYQSFCSYAPQEIVDVINSLTAPSDQTTEDTEYPAA